MGGPLPKHEPTPEEQIEELKAELHSVEMEMARRTAELIETQGELAWVKQRQEKRVRELTTVYKAARLMLTAGSFEDLASQILKLAAEEIDAGVGSLMMVEGDRLVVRAVYGGAGSSLELVGQQQPMTEGVSGWVARAGRPLLISNISEHPLFHERSGRYVGQSCLSAPLHVHGHVRGVINVTNKLRGHEFDEDDMRLLRTLATTASIALENIDLNEERKRSERMVTIGELAAKMAHEIRNPLQAIKMNIQILGKKFPLEGKHKVHYEILEGEVDRIEKLVANLLAFARPDRLNLIECNVNDVLERVMTIMEPVITSKKIELVQHLADDLSPIRADPDKLTQAFMNLVINAVEAMPTGGSLIVSSMLITPVEYPFPFNPAHMQMEGPFPRRDRPPYIEIKITDTGCGIPAAIQDKIFNPFYTTKVHGTGLGLSTTVKIVEQHRGRLTFTSRENVGTTVTVDLPTTEGTL